MCGIALDIQKQPPLLYFQGYTNGCRGYLPTAEEYFRGGYEVLWSNLIYFRYHGRVMPLNYNTAKQITRIVAEEWNKLIEM